MHILAKVIPACIVWHFIGATLLKQKELAEKERKNYLQIITCDPLIYTMDHPKFIVSHQKEESINT